MNAGRKTGSTTGETTRRGRPRSEEADQAILAATLEVLVDRGYDGLSFEAVASAAGVGRPTIYRRWKSKESLVAAAIESWRPETIVPDSGSLDADIEALIGLMGDLLKQRDLLMRNISMMNVLFSSESLRKTWISAHFLPRWRSVRTIFEHAVARGELDESADLDELTVLVAAVLLYRYLVPIFATRRKRPQLPDQANVKESIDRVLLPWRAIG